MHDVTTGVVVGIDGSAQADLALRWAVSKSHLFGPVMPVYSYTVEPFGYGIGSPQVHSEMTRLMKQAAEVELAEALASHPDLSEKALVLTGHPGANLVESAARHRLLVVGSRGRGGLAETVLGSTASYCVTHSPVPVIVVPEGSDVSPSLTRIVVGVDGSANSARALGWAVDHVEPLGQVVAVGCWVPAIPNRTLPSDEAGMAELTDRVTTMVDEVGHASVEIRIERGDPRLVLRELAAGTDLLVMGARGHRGVSYLLLGSTTTSILHDPPCPTAVIPEL
jgi:nucleotide-binding universal stress UspA family protein